MSSILNIILAIFAVMLISLIYFFREGIRAGLFKLRAKLQIQSIRTAIKDADENKEETGRKNIVALSAIDGNYKPYQKKVLKQAAAANKNKSNAAMTPGRKWFMSKTKKKKRVLDYEKVKEVEKKSLYATN